MKKQTEDLTDAEWLRQKAEELLKLRTDAQQLSTDARPCVSKNENDLLKLIHELQVHQIELEMQNEELVKAKEKAELAEEKYTELYEFAPSGYLSLSKDGKISELNFAAAKMLGRERTHFQNSSFGFFVSADTKPVFNRFLEEAFRCRTKASCAVTLMVNGQPPMHVMLSGICNEKGHYCKLTMIDITERKQAEDKMLAEVAFRNSIELSLRSGIAIADDDGRQSYVNPFFCELVGWPEEYLLGKKAPFVYWPPDQLPAIDEAFRQTIAGHAPQEGFELEFMRKNGVRFPVQIIISPFTNGNQRTGWLANVIDITKRKQMEMALKDSENHSRSMIEAIPDLMFVLNSEGVYLDFKADVADLVYQKESIIGKKMRDITPPDFADLIDEKIKLTLQTGSIQIFEYQLDVPQKGTCYYEARMVQFSSDKVMAIVRDITERKISDAKIRQINEQLNKLNSTKDKFFNIIAHDLKSPFNAIMGFSDLLVEQIKEKDYDGIDQYASIILKSSQHAIDLLMNLLDWARSQTGRMEFSPEYFEMVELTDETFEQLNNTASQKAITLQKELPKNLPVFADKNMISTVIRNLISNAIKYTGEGGEIVLSAKKNPDNILVSVKDNGLGIAPERIEKLFRIDTNVSTPGTNKEKGTGLGLILCKEFIEKHDGKIWVESAIGQGSVFSFSIPLKSY
jgi:PAS domain S-box-containing protein